MSVKGTKGRAGDVACYRCGRPMVLAHAWKQKVTKHGKVFTNYFCAEHVVITDSGQRWRPLEPGETPPELTMGDPEPGTPDVAPMTPVGELAGGIAWEDIKAAKTDPNAPRFEDEYQQLPPPERPADDDFNPLDDVGF